MNYRVSGRFFWKQTKYTWIICKHDGGNISVNQIFICRYGIQTHSEREGGYREKAGKGGTLWNILKVLGSIRERPGRLGNIKSMHCNVNWLLTLIICLGSALALSAVTLAGLSKYGMGWNGERWVGGGGQVRMGVGKKGCMMPGYHHGVMGTLKFCVRFGKWHPVDVFAWLNWFVDCKYSVH